VAIYNILLKKIHLKISGTIEKGFNNIINRLNPLNFERGYNTGVKNIPSCNI
jgi:hypothetical protein